MLDISRGTKRGIALSTAPLLAGIAMQYAVGPADIRATAFPVNACIGAGFALSLIIAYLLRNKSALINGLTSCAAAIAAIASVIIVTLITGIVKQTSDTSSAWHDMLSSWPFILSYTWLAVILGLTTVKNIATFSLRKAPVAFSHAGLLLALICGALGSADVCRLDMPVSEGHTEWQTIDNDSRITMAPFGITLDRLEIKVSADNMPEQISACITADRKSGARDIFSVKVNHPIRIDGWDVYLSDYSEPASGFTTATFRLIRDPWLPAVYAGIAMMSIGALLTLFLRTDRKKPAS